MRSSVRGVMGRKETLSKGLHAHYIQSKGVKITITVTLCTEIKQIVVTPPELSRRKHLPPYIKSTPPE
ncbi:hypothetical protein QVD17_00486 [Tagetes erecta]|uniref:Uncharacterized protein n=1 Tax=Tagetes erecta TaxID=13708 RepID=A0AAD8L8V8_TARER|nr:hypothetical protein QVD17_00486 [Tagetes erecta]